MNASEILDFSKDAVLLFVLAKIDQYQGEIDFFKNKYKQDFEEVETKAHSRKGHEDFGVEEDLEDWEFACKSLEWWTKKYIELKNDVDAA